MIPIAPTYDRTARTGDGLYDSWSRTVLTEALDTIARGIHEVAGWGAVMVLSRHDDHTFHFSSVTGDENAKQALRGAHLSRNRVLDEIAMGQRQGGWLFVPQERRAHIDALWAPDPTGFLAPDAWQPHDLLLAPFSNEQGALVAVLMATMPRDGLRPDRDALQQLEMYAERASGVVQVALERDRMSEKVRLAGVARTIVAQTSAKLTLRDGLAECAEAIMKGLEADDIRIEVFGGEESGEGLVFSSNPKYDDLPPQIMERARAASAELWRARYADVAHRSTSRPSRFSPAGWAVARDAIQMGDLLSVMFLPLGAGDEVVGYCMLSRTVGGRPWTPLEADIAMDLGHDLGRALLNARLFQHELNLVQQLQRMDAYRDQLIRTVAHEIKNPSAVISGHLELLRDADPEGRNDVSLDAIERSVSRLRKLGHDLVQLARGPADDEPAHSDVADLVAAAREVSLLVGLQAEQKGIAIDLDLPAEPVTVWCEASSMDRLVSNLLSNAIKYTPAGGRVEVRVRTSDRQGVLEVADSGIGISEADQENLFTEFYRSSNPQALAQPGSGLGLAIVQRIVHQYAGTIDVTSTLGAGTTFTVRLDARAADLNVPEPRTESLTEPSA